MEEPSARLPVDVGGGSFLRRRFGMGWRSLVAAVAVSGVGVFMSCNRGQGVEPEPVGFAAARERMVVDQIEARGVADPRVLAAMRKVPREELVPEDGKAPRGIPGTTRSAFS